MNLPRLAANAASLAGGGIVAQLCFVAIEATIARHIGQDGYGAYGAVYAIALVIVLIADVGMNSKLIEEGARDRIAISRLLGTMVALKLFACAVIYPVAMLLLPLAGYGQAIVGAFSIFFIYAVLYILQETCAAVYYARQRMHVNALFQAATPIAILAAVSIGTVLSRTLSAVAWAYVAGAAVVVVTWGYMTFVSEHPRVDLRQSWRILRGSYLYGVTSVLYQASLRLDLMLLSLWRDLMEVGLFAAGDKLADLGLKVGIMYSRVITPMLFAQSRHDPEKYRRSCEIVLRGVSMFGALGCLALALLAKPLLVMVFGASFGAGAVALGVLALSLFARLVAVALQVILSASGEHARRTGSVAVALGAAAAANVALIPAYGIIGAAVARTIGDGVQATALLGARNLPIRRHAASAWILGPLLLGVAVYLLVPRLPVHFTLQLPIALAAYALGLVGARMIRLTELRELARSFRSAAR